MKLSLSSYSLNASHELIETPCSHTCLSILLMPFGTSMNCFQKSPDSATGTIIVWERCTPDQLTHTARLLFSTRCRQVLTFQIDGFAYIQGLSPGLLKDHHNQGRNLTREHRVQGAQLIRASWSASLQWRICTHPGVRTNTTPRKSASATRRLLAETSRDFRAHPVMNKTLSDSRTPFILPNCTDFACFIEKIRRLTITLHTLQLRQQADEYREPLTIRFPAFHRKWRPWTSVSCNNQSAPGCQLPVASDLAAVFRTYKHV